MVEIINQKLHKKNYSVMPRLKSEQKARAERSIFFII